MRCPVCRSAAVRERPEHTAQGIAGSAAATAASSSTSAARAFCTGRISKRRDRPRGALTASLQSSSPTRPFVTGKPSSRQHWLRNCAQRRRGKVGRGWYVDETYIRVRGRWWYLYRAIDRDGALVDVMLSEHRDLAAAKTFLRSAKAVTGIAPDRVTTDGHDAYPQAIRIELGKRVRHRTSRYLNNRLEQDHRGIKGRC
jgi:DDE domain